MDRRGAQRECPGRLSPRAARAEAHAYVDPESSEERIRRRYEWLFTYDAAAVAVRTLKLPSSSLRLIQRDSSPVCSGAIERLQSLLLPRWRTAFYSMSTFWSSSLKARKR